METGHLLPTLSPFFIPTFSLSCAGVRRDKPGSEEFFAREHGNCIRVFRVLGTPTTPHATRPVFVARMGETPETFSLCHSRGGFCGGARLFVSVSVQNASSSKSN